MSAMALFSLVLVFLCFLQASAVSYPPPYEWHKEKPWQSKLPNKPDYHKDYWYTSGKKFPWTKPPCKDADKQHHPPSLRISSPQLSNPPPANHGKPPSYKPPSPSSKPPAPYQKPPSYKPPITHSLPPYQKPPPAVPKSPQSPPKSPPKSPPYKPTPSPKPHASPSPYINPLAKQFLDPHNAARSALGLPPLVWNDTVAEYAQWWANQRRLYGNCQMKHSEGPYGENLFWGIGYPFSPQDCVDAWTSEKQYYHYNSNSCDPNEKCGHYTQIVWKTTERLGCARVECDSGDIFMTCNYDPPGNWIGYKPY